MGRLKLKKDVGTEEGRNGLSRERIIGVIEINDDRFVSGQTGNCESISSQNGTA